jgi:hypothetical protein
MGLVILTKDGLRSLCRFPTRLLLATKDPAAAEVLKQGYQVRSLY